MWQEVREELHPHNFELVTVCLDVAGAAAARPFIEAARPRHPALIDVEHRTGEVLGMVNIPSGVWIDEAGVIVRPAEPAFARRPPTGGSGPAADAGADRMTQILAEAAHIRIDPERYLVALRDWVEQGAASPYALPPEEVVRRSRPRPPEASRAAAHFELGQHLHRAGHAGDAVVHFREAHRLQPDNWTYKRQAWSLVPSVEGPLARYWQGPAPGREDQWPYDGDWLSDVRQIGPENYYPALDM